MAPLGEDLRFLVSEPEGASDLDGELLSKILVGGVCWFDILGGVRSVGWQVDWSPRSVDFMVPCVIGVDVVPINLFRVLANVLRGGGRRSVVELTERMLAH